MRKITPENITHLEPNQVFVFGSNLGGFHGAGAALLAFRKFGAKKGQGIGLAGRTYALPTKNAKIKTLPLSDIELHVKDFLRFAEAHPELEFLVTQIGCGLAGYSPEDIAPLFGNGVPTNVVLPISFLPFIQK